MPEEGLPKEAGDFLLVMGGPMSVNDPDRWIEQEIEFIRRTIRLGKPVLGVCLGAQLMARALGAPVRPGPALELGMTPIRLTEEGRKDPIFSRLPEPASVFEWHGEIFDLPAGAVPLATSDLCLQAFRYGERAYGLLFHLEMERAGIEALCRECPEDVRRAGTSPAALLREAEPHLSRLHDWASFLIEHLTS
ncbi:MAG: type 1 glutamine amidotransferase [Nitrospirota bacterium]